MIKDIYKEKMVKENKMFEILMQIKLYIGDINNANTLTDKFFERDDIDLSLKNKLKNLNDEIISLNKEIFKNS